MFVVSVWLFCPIANANAQGPPDVDAKEFKFQYAAKFVCGTNPGATDRVVPGLYATAINIHNPSAKDAILFKKVALTFPPPQQQAG